MEKKQPQQLAQPPHIKDQPLSEYEFEALLSIRERIDYWTRICKLTLESRAFLEGVFAIIELEMAIEELTIFFGEERIIFPIELERADALYVRAVDLLARHFHYVLNVLMAELEQANGK